LNLHWPASIASRVGARPADDNNPVPKPSTGGTLDETVRAPCPMRKATRDVEQQASPRSLTADPDEQRDRHLAQHDQCLLGGRAWAKNPQNSKRLDGGTMGPDNPCLIDPFRAARSSQTQASRHAGKSQIAGSGTASHKTQFGESCRPSIRDGFASCYAHRDGNNGCGISPQPLTLLASHVVHLFVLRCRISRSAFRLRDSRLRPQAILASAASGSSIGDDREPGLPPGHDSNKIAAE